MLSRLWERGELTMDARFVVRSHEREGVAIKRKALVDSYTERAGEPIYELEGTGVRLKPINRRVFWCDATSEVYRRVRVPVDS
jgi:hypothetical protein